MRETVSYYAPQSVIRSEARRRSEGSHPALSPPRLIESVDLKVDAHVTQMPTLSGSHAEVRREFRI